MKVFGKRLLSVSVVMLMLTALVMLSACNRSRPPDSVEDFSAKAGDGEVYLSWSNPQHKDLAGIRIMRTTGEPPASPTDGLQLYNDLGEELTDRSVANGNRYFYAAWAFDSTGKFSPAAHLQATPVSTLAQEEVLDRLSKLADEVTEIPEINSEEQDMLLEILEEAEELFLSGDACAATELLQQEFSEWSQQIRQTRSRDAGEQLYAEGRRIRINMARAMEDKEECEALQRIDVQAAIEVEEEDAEGFSAWSAFGEALFSTVAVSDPSSPEELFTEIFVPGADAFLGRVGAPAVPVYRRFFAAPMGTDVDVFLKWNPPSVAEEFFVNLYPTQASPMDQIGDTSIFEDPPFEIDLDIYESSLPWPPRPVSVQYVGTGRDLEYYLVETAAGQYYPAENRLQLFDFTKFDIEFQGGIGSFATTGMTSAFESNSHVLLESLINRITVTSSILERKYEHLGGEELLILTHPDFFDAAIKLQGWKRAKGIVTNVFECGTGSDVQGRERNTEIDAFIEGRFRNMRIRPSYILLLGDAEFIAPFYIDNIGTDWPYAVLGDPRENLIPDFAVGRIPVDTAAQAMTVVDKIIDYEKTPIDDVDFYKNAVVAGQFECCRRGATEVGTDGRTFIECAEFAHQTMTGAGKQVQRVYEATGNMTPTRYYSGEMLPVPLRSTSQFEWNGTGRDISNAWNDGAFLVLHRDHGFPHGWVHPEFTSLHVNALTNGDKLPVVFSINCSTGVFDNETSRGAENTDSSGVYFAERLIRHENGGAVGVFGATRVSPSWANSVLTMGFFDAIWPGPLTGVFGLPQQRRLGDILNHGKRHVIAQSGQVVLGAEIREDSAQSQLYLWHCLGDPTLEIWTRNPHTFKSPIVSIIEHQFVVHRDGIDLSGGILVEYEIENAVITIFAQGPDQEIPLGRGVVENGVAQIAFLDEHNMSNELIMVASFEDRPATILGTPVIR